jgi:hypothetical protein
MRRIKWPFTDFVVSFCVPKLICQNLNHTVRESTWVLGGLESGSPRQCFFGPELRFEKC